MVDGVSYIFKRYGKPNNAYMKYYDPDQKSKHITHLVANHLYGYAKSTFLPTSGFKWINPKEFDLNKYNSNSSKDCALKADLDYPKELCKLHSNYPLAPDKIEIKREMLSIYQLKIADLYNVLICNVKKLVLNFFDKESMFLIIKTLKVCLC